LVVGALGLVLGGRRVVLGARVLGLRTLGVRVIRLGVVGRLRRGILRGAGDLGAAAVTGGRRVLALRGAAGGEGEDESGDGGSGAEGARGEHPRYLARRHRGAHPSGSHHQGKRCWDVKDSSAGGPARRKSTRLN